MSGLVRQFLLPVSRSLHQGTLSMFIPRHTYSTDPPAEEPPVKPKKQVLTDPEELKIKKLFNAYDQNNNGWISRGEWYDVVFKFLGDKDSAWVLAEKVMDDLDMDVKDEKITFSEFRAGMKSQWHLFKPKIDKVQK